MPLYILLARFVLPEIISENDDLVDIVLRDLKGDSIFWEESATFFGTMTKQYAKRIDIIETNFYKRLPKNAKQFYNEKQVIYKS